MSYFTLLRLFNVCKWILIFILFFGDWHMLCQRLKRCTPNICLQTIWVYYFYHVHFPCVCLGLCCFVLCRCLLVFYLFISYLFMGFWFFCNNPFVLRSFLALLSLHCLLVYYYLLVVYLFISLVVVWIFDYFVSGNIVLQQYICLLSIDTRL
jgi:hypothetical protein